MPNLTQEETRDELATIRVRMQRITIAQSTIRAACKHTEAVALLVNDQQRLSIACPECGEVWSIDSTEPAFLTYPRDRIANLAVIEPLES